MTTAPTGRASLVFMLLLALAAGPGAGGCGKYGRPVRSEPGEVRELAADEREAGGGFDADRPEEQPGDENGRKERKRERPEQGGTQ